MDALEFVSILIKKAPLRLFAFIVSSVVSWCGVPFMSAYWREWSLRQTAWYEMFCVSFPVTFVLFLNLICVVYKYKKAEILAEQMMCKQVKKYKQL
jgi:hypothetical protein